MRLLSLIACSASHYRLPPTCSSLGDALRHAVRSFADAHVPEPHLSAQYLLGRAVGCTEGRAALQMRLRSPLLEPERTLFEQLCTQRLRRVPVQYILGDWDFHEITLRVEAPVLIPRPETEELVELVLAQSRGKPSLRNARLLDIGCGSGAIGLALLNKWPHASCVAIDVSEQAVDLSRRNAEELCLRGRYEARHIAGIDEFVEAIGDSRFDVIVSNPPYIPQEDMRTLEPEVVENEDRRALCGGTDGLDVVREIVRAAPRLLNPLGPRKIWLEVDSSHPPLIEAWLGNEAQLGVKMVEAVTDSSDLPRFCVLSWSGTTA